MSNPWDTSTPTIDKPEWLTAEIETALKRDNYPANQDGMLMLWKDWENRLREAKETEMEYRKICAAFLVPNKTEGTNTVELGNAYQAKVNLKYNYKLNSDNKKVWAGLDKISATGNEGKFIAERLVSWTPNFLLTEYRQLQEDAEGGSEQAKFILTIINEFLTITDAAPELKIVEPKVKKK